MCPKEGVVKKTCKLLKTNYLQVFVPRADIVPIHKTNLRETKSKQIQCLHGVTLALVFLKKHIICLFVTPMLHPNQKLFVPLQPTETKGK